MSFGIDSAADFRATETHECLKEAGFHVTYTLRSPQGQWHKVRLNVGGRHNIYNSLAAAAAASAAGATPSMSLRDWARCSRCPVACSRGARSRARG